MAASYNNMNWNWQGQLHINYNGVPSTPNFPCVTVPEGKLLEIMKVLPNLPAGLEMDSQFDT